MKKLIALLLALVMCFGMIACDNADQPDQNPEETPVVTPEPTP